MLNKFAYLMNAKCTAHPSNPPRVIELPYLMNCHPFQSCIRLPVCGGCCPSERLRCSAIESTKQNISLLHLRFSARDRRFQLGGVVRVQVEKHRRCACQCVTQPGDCRPGQLYRADECRCICPMAIKAACLKRQRAVGSLLARFIIWKPERCECECKAPGGVRRCSSGLWFDARTCRYRPQWGFPT